MPENIALSTLAQVKAAGRLYYMDSLKVLLAIIVVIHHAGQPYGPGGGWWIAPEPLQPICQIVLGAFFAVNMSFFMGLFFLISAYFTPASLDKKGTFKFLKEKLIRFGVPVAIFLLLVFPVMQYLLYYPGTMSFSEYFFTLYLNPDKAFKGGPGMTMGHLWFLEQLMLFAAFYALWRFALRCIGNKPLKRIGIPGNYTIASVTLLLGFTMFVIRIWSPINHWTPWLVFEPAHYPGYIALFAAGILAYRNGWIEELTTSTGKMWGNISMITFAALPVLSVVFGDGLFSGGATVASLFGAVWEAFMCTSLCISLIALFKNRYNVTDKLRKALADNSFTVYLIHVPIIIFLQYMLIGVELHPLIKFALVSVVGVPASFLISHFVVRKLPYAKRILG